MFVSPNNCANMRKRTAVLEHIKGVEGGKSVESKPLTTPAKDSHQEPPAKTHGPAPGLLPRPAAARAGRRDDTCVGARGQAGRGSVLHRTLVPAVPWLYAPSSPRRTRRSRARARRWRLRLCRATATRWPLIPTSRRCRGWHTVGAAARPFAHLDGAQ
jgi:hypothetical protein